MVWCGVVWRGVVWCGVFVAWCGVVSCRVVWWGVVWCGVVWRGEVWWLPISNPTPSLLTSHPLSTHTFHPHLSHLPPPSIQLPPMSSSPTTQEKSYADWMAAFKLATHGRTMADHTYESEVQAILSFLQIHHPNPSPQFKVAG